MTPLEVNLDPETSTLDGGQSLENHCSLLQLIIAKSQSGGNISEEGEDEDLEKELKTQRGRAVVSREKGTGSRRRQNNFSEYQREEKDVNTG